MSPSDAELVRRWQRGDSTAAAALTRRHRDAVGAVVWAILRSPEGIEDALQETFLRATRAIRRLEHPDRVASFLAGIARHVAVDMLRQNNRHARTAGEVHAAPSPEVSAERAELRRKLDAALNALPQDQRELFLLKYVAGLSYADIARTLDTTPEAIGQKLWRIRQKLQRDLAEFHPNPAQDRAICGAHGPAAHTPISKRIPQE